MELGDDPYIKSLLDDARVNLVPMIRDASMTAALYDGPRDDVPDLRYALEIGLSVLMNIPIVVVGLNGEAPEGKLAQVADHVLLMEPGEFGSEAGNAKLQGLLEKLADDAGLT